MTPPVLELSGLVKDYRGLRPLRIEQLTVDRGEQLAIMGLDQVAAEVFVNLVTGATLPDRGDVRTFGRATSEIADSAAWLANADRFGIVSERAVLLDALTVVQNLALPFSLEIDPPPPDAALGATRLAEAMCLSEAERDRLVGELEPLARVKVRVARALAFNPDVLLLEHPTAGLPRSDVPTLAEQVRAAATSRGIAAVSITEDREFADRVAPRVLALEAATGRLGEARRRWFSW